MTKQEKWQSIIDVVPVLKKRYKVTIYAHHIRVKVKGNVYYDYYPKGERVGKCTNGYYSKFRDLSIDNFKDRFIG